MAIDATMPMPSTVDPKGLSRRVGLIGCACLVLMFFINPTAALRAYLFAFCCVLAIPIGGLAVVMLQYLTGGGWGVIVRRPLEAAIRTLPIIALMFLPIALGANRLYPWALPGAIENHPQLAHKASYLNLNAFWLRAGIYFAVWILLSSLLTYWSSRQDGQQPEGYERRFRLVSGPGLVALGLTITFASIDWVMSLEPLWFSSIYGVIFGMGQMISAFTFAILIVLFHANERPLKDTLTPGHLRDLGNLLMAFVMTWAYVSVSQLILIWSANLKEEVPHYLARIHSGWAVVAIAIAALQFGLPFLLLLGRQSKRKRDALMRIAALVFVMRIVDTYWLVAPGRPVDGRTVFLADLAALAGLGGIWFAIYTWELSRRPLLPIGVDASVAEDHHV